MARARLRASGRGPARCLYCGAPLPAEAVARPSGAARRDGGAAPPGPAAPSDRVLVLLACWRRRRATRWRRPLGPVRLRSRAARPRAAATSCIASPQPEAATRRPLACARPGCRVHAGPGGGGAARPTPVRGCWAAAARARRCELRTGEGGGARDAADDLLAGRARPDRARVPDPGAEPLQARAHGRPSRRATASTCTCAAGRGPLELDPAAFDFGRGRRSGSSLLALTAWIARRWRRAVPVGRRLPRACARPGPGRAASRGRRPPPPARTRGARERSASEGPPILDNLRAVPLLLRLARRPCERRAGPPLTASAGPVLPFARIARGPPMKLIVQIPCLNEEATLPATLRAIPRQIAGHRRGRGAGDRRRLHRPHVARWRARTGPTTSCASRATRAWPTASWPGSTPACGWAPTSSSTPTPTTSTRATRSRA